MNFKMFTSTKVFNMAVNQSSNKAIKVSEIIFSTELSAPVLFIGGLQKKLLVRAECVR